MKYVIAFLAMVAMLGFVSPTRAADGKPPKPKPGHFIKIEESELIYKGGAKGKGGEHKVKVDDKTKYTVDGKDSTLADFQKDVKADEYIEVTVVDKVATVVAASSVAPAPTTKPAKTGDTPKTSDSPKTGTTDSK